jgi:hypothetical protein
MGIFLLEDYWLSWSGTYMHMHGIVKIDAGAFIALEYP